MHKWFMFGLNKFLPKTSPLTKVRHRAHPPPPPARPNAEEI